MQRVDAPLQARARKRVIQAWARAVAFASATFGLAPQLAHAGAPPTSEAGLPASVASDTTVIVTSPEGAAWPEAAEAIAFELDQAGYAVRTSPRANARASNFAVEIERTGGEWQLRCSGEALSVQERGSVSDGPDFVALLAVELIVASRARPPAEPPRDAEIRTSPPEPFHTAPAPSIPVPRTQSTSPWAGELGATLGGLGELGMIGAEAGLRHRWERTELGVHAAVGALTTSEASEAADGSSSSLEMRAFARVGLGAFYVFRPGRRLRPSLGATTNLLLPVVRSAQTGTRGEPQLRFDTRVTSTGVLWTPSANAGIRVGVRPRLAWKLSVFAGPALAILRPKLASGGRFAFADWTAGVSTGIMFGSGASPPR